MADKAADWKKYLVSCCKIFAIGGGTFVSAWVLGDLAGWLVGTGGPEAAEIVASLVPAILSLVGGGLTALLVVVRSRDTVSAVLILVFIVTFCLIFRSSVESSIIQRYDFDKWSARAAEIQKVEKRRLELEEREFKLEACTRMEIKINNTRKILGQALLPPEYFCEVLP